MRKYPNMYAQINCNPEFYYNRSLNELLYLKGLNMLYEDSMSFTVCQNSTKSAWEIWPHQGNLTH